VPKSNKPDPDEENEEAEELERERAKQEADAEARRRAQEAELERELQEAARQEKATADAEARATAEADLSAKMKAQPSDVTSEDESGIEADSISLAVSELSMTLGSDDDEMMETPRDRKPKTKPTDQGDKEESKKFKQAQRNVSQKTKTEVGKRSRTETYQ